MANKEQLDLLKQRVATCNQWRREHSGRLTLSQANRRKSVLSGATLRETLRLAPFRPLPLRNISLLVFILNTFLVACVPLGSTSKPAPVSSQPVSPLMVNPQYACQRSKPVATLSLAGLAYSPYHTGQDPNYGVFPSAEEVAADIPTLACLTNYIRIYSSLGPAKDIVQDAEQAHISVNLGIWLGSNADANAREIAAGIQLASKKAVCVITVGSEVLQRHDMSEADLHKAIQQVRAKLSTSGHPVQITMADDDRMWLSHPALANDVDFITVHIYPFWEHVSINDAIQALDATYKHLQQTFPHKPIVIGETGWPSDGPPQGAAVPSAENQSRYFREFIAWAKRQEEKVQYFYFNAFDETWKTNESGVGTYWGLYQEGGVVKPALSDLLPVAASATLKERSYRDIYVGGLEVGFGLGIGTSNQQRNWLTNEQGTLLLSYPANQLWGTMFITFGKPAPPGNRPSIDLSRYHSLVVDMRAGVDGQCIRLGIKDRAQPDNGSETTLQQCLSTDWSTITLPLDAFTNVDLNHVYVIFEIIFQGTSSATVELRNIRYSPTD